MKNFLKFLTLCTTLFTAIACNDNSAASENSKSINYDIACPELVSWQIANYDGIPKLFYLFKNNCNLDISFTFVATYYQNGSEIGKTNEITFECVAPFNECFNFDTWEVKKDADNVTFEILHYERSRYESISTNVFSETLNTGLINNLEVEIRELGNYLDTIVFVPFYDSNDKIVWCYFKGFYNGEQVKFTIDLEGQTFDHYLLYATSYKLK